MKYRKKPVTIEAFQMTRERRTSYADWPEWLHRAWNCDPGSPGAVKPEDFPESDGTDRLTITTLVGELTLQWDDWIICGIRGELYPCKPDIFQETYEEVEDS